MRKALFWGLVAAALVAGLAFRLARLDARPMHHDEANQAVKFGTLLETGSYLYDPADHHGPTLYYLTLPSAWLRGQTTLASLDERTVRMVPALFGVGLLFLFALLARDIGRPAAAMAVLLGALSPALTFYSRFYIQETVLAFFALGFVIALGRWAERGSTAWAAASGAFAGLAFATKETSVVVIGAGLVASVAARIAWHVHGPALQHPPSAAWQHLRGGAWQHLRRVILQHRNGAEARLVAHLLAAAACALVVVVVFYSSFFTNAAGPQASVRSFAVYLRRGVDAGTHGEPWYYYLRLLAFSPGPPAWTEALVLVLALLGAVFAFGRRGGFWPTYLTLYSVVACAAFSVVRYKTPWNLLPFYIGFIPLAGYGAARAVGRTRSVVVKGVMIAALSAGIAQLAVQDWRANFRYPADTRNPYVYAHTTTDFLRLVQRVADVAAVDADKDRMLVKVVAGPYEQWPLPWYLRRMPRVGYWSRAEQVDPLEGAPGVIIASQENANVLDPILAGRYVSEFYGLRPDVLLTLYIDRGLWERFLEGRK